MSQPQRAFFTATDLDSLNVTTALVEGDVLTIETAVVEKVSQDEDDHGHGHHHH